MRLLGESEPSGPPTCVKIIEVARDDPSSAWATAPETSSQPSLQPAFQFCAGFDHNPLVQDSSMNHRAR